MQQKLSEEDVIVIGKQYEEARTIIVRTPQGEERVRIHPIDLEAKIQCERDNVSLYEGLAATHREKLRIFQTLLAELLVEIEAPEPKPEQEDPEVPEVEPEPTDEPEVEPELGPEPELDEPEIPEGEPEPELNAPEEGEEVADNG